MCAKQPLLSPSTGTIPKQSHEIKILLTQIAKVYTAVSKHLNYQLKKLQVTDTLPSELDIPFLGGVVVTNSTSLEFKHSSLLSEEGGLPMRTKGARQELNMGKIAEVCMIGREQVKNILQAFSLQTVSRSVSISFNRRNLSNKGSWFSWTSDLWTPIQPRFSHSPGHRESSSSTKARCFLCSINKQRRMIQRRTQGSR